MAHSHRYNWPFHHRPCRLLWSYHRLPLQTTARPNWSWRDAVQWTISVHRCSYRKLWIIEKNNYEDWSEFLDSKQCDYLKASLSSSSPSADFIFFDIMSRNSLNSIVPFPLMSTSFTMLRNSFSVWNHETLPDANVIDDMKIELNVHTAGTLAQWTHHNSKLGHCNSAIFVLIEKHERFFEFWRNEKMICFFFHLLKFPVFHGMKNTWFQLIIIFWNSTKIQRKFAHFCRAENYVRKRWRGTAPWKLGQTSMNAKPEHISNFTSNTK